MAEKKIEEFDPSIPLKNSKHEKFVISLVSGLSRSQAYLEAGYSCTKEQSRKQAERLLKTNKDVRERYNYLIELHNIELEERGIISRERMLKKALYALSCCLGEKPVQKASRHSMTMADDDGVEELPSEIEKKMQEEGMTSSPKAISTQWWTNDTVYEHDLKAFGGIWDKIMQAMNYYPKETKEVELNINKPDKDNLKNLISKVKGVKK